MLYPRYVQEPHRFEGETPPAMGQQPFPCPPGRNIFTEERFLHPDPPRAGYANRTTGGGMNWLLWAAVILVVLWVLAEVLGWVLGALLHLLWIGAIILFVLWLVGKIRSKT
jgi:hypothetical protein